MEVRNLRLTQDGACDNNSKFKFMGIGVAGWVDGKRDLSLNHHSMFGIQGTNNVAEWGSFLKAMETAYIYCQEHPNTKVSIYGDSQIIINQFKGIYKVKAAHLREYYDKSQYWKGLLGSNLKRVEWFRRENNTEADELSKLGITEYFKKNNIV